MKGLQVFENQEFGAIRTLLKDNEPWFAAVDVCRALDISNNRDAVSRLDADEKGVVLTDTLGGKQNLAIVSEAGLYALILGSRKPEARAFKRWITHDVIPSIRKHGMYATPDTLEKLIVDPDFGIRLLTELKSERAKCTTLEAQSAQQQRELVEIRPKAAYYDLILQNPSTITVTQIAKDYGMSAVMFNRLLERLGLQYRQGGAWQLYQKYASRGYTQSRTEQVSEEHAVTYTCWTQAGRRFLYDFLKENANGMLPMIEREAAI